MFCGHCGYDLAGLDDYRCPECGTPFDVVAPTASRVSVTDAMVVLVAVPLLSTVLFCSGIASFGERALIPFLFLVATGVLGTSAWLAGAITQPDPASGRKSRRQVIRTLLLMFAFMFVQASLLAGVGFGLIQVACGMGPCGYS